MTLVDMDAPAPKQRKTPVNYNAKTTAWMREQGYVFDKTESFNVFSNQRRDFMGFADYIAITNEYTIAIQAAGADFAPHIKKLTEQRRDAVTAWLSGPRKLYLIGWRKLVSGKRRLFKMRLAEFMLNEKGEIVWQERA